MLYNMNTILIIINISKEVKKLIKYLLVPKL